jgi:general secretion pathway protein D
MVVPRVNVSSGQPAGGGGGAGGGGFQGGQGGGLRFVTRTNGVEEVQAAVRNFFITMGVDLNPGTGKTLFWNDRQGILLVRATAQDLDIIESAVQILNVAPPQINIKAKFCEITQTDTKALGFDWYLGNFLMNNGSIGAQGGTAPTFAGQPSPANPLGSFPGSPLTGTAIAPSPSDQFLTSGLRNLANAPAVGTLTGILTDPQFRVVVRALEQRDGVDLLSAPEVNTLSGRQAQVQIVDIPTIVVNVNLQQATGAGGQVGGVGGGAGVVGAGFTYDTVPVPLGPVLDVIPYVSADGYTIQMTIIPTITEFVGYDDPGEFVPQAQSVSGGAGGVGIPLTASLPLPRFRLRQVTTSAIVYDGQTVVLGGLMTETVTRLKDKVPVIGDLPLVGRLFRSEQSQTFKKNLIIFVTPTIVDPAGNRYHSEDDMPFNLNTIPTQRAVPPGP